ncbi:MAG: hypothetical protein AB2A00_30840 [Myxococcota bacterium]
MAGSKVGGEVDCFCTRCKMVLAHTVLAMVGTRPARVQCNTCHTDRNYRPVDGEDRAPRRREPAEPAKPGRAGVVRESDYDRLMKNRDLSRAPRYSVKTTYALETVIDHPTFGLGLVTSVKGPDKVEVLFRDGPKVLVHGKGG